MTLRWFKKLNPRIQIVVLAVVAALFFVFYVGLIKYFTPSVAALLSPPLAVSESASFNAREFLAFQDLLAENKKLKQKIDSLSFNLNQLTEIQLENERLRGLLSLSQRQSFKTQAAEVIARDSSNWSRTIIINKGKGSGIKPGMAVVSGAALVGKVTEVNNQSSKVALIIDFNVKTPAKILRTREEGLVVGAFKSGKDICKIKYVQDVKIGDEVISSDLAGLYPKGLLIGTVVSLGQIGNDFYQSAEVKPVVDAGSLEEVMVVLSK